MIRMRARGARGFTLIELLIAMAIVAILATIAVASYDFAMVKTRRAAAKGCLMEGAQFMERYYTLHFSYADAELPACSADVTDFYAVGFTDDPTVDAFTIQAVPNERQDDAACGTLSVDDTGVKGADDVAACW